MKLTGNQGSVPPLRLSSISNMLAVLLCVFTHSTIPADDAIAHEPQLSRATQLAQAEVDQLQPGESRQRSGESKSRELAVKTQGYAYLSTYGFRPGDGLQIRVYPDTAAFMNGIFYVDDSGYADLPVVGPVYVNGHNPDQVETILRQDYVDYLPYPNVQVRPLMRIALLGGFFEPGLYYVQPSASLWDAVQLAGGPEREDGFDKIRWRRDGMVMKRNVVGMLQSGTSLYKLGFQSGDQLTVVAQPKRRFWDIVTDDVLPVLSFSLSLVTSAITIGFISTQD